MKSILQKERDQCFLCEAHGALEEHHVFFGTANRKQSEKYGLKVYLCHRCHNEPPFGVHHCRPADLALKRRAQKVAMHRYKWTLHDFIQLFGRNYL